MRTGTLVLAVCGIVLLGLGSTPRYIEELRIGGGYGEATDGGADFDQGGGVLTDGAVSCADVTARGGNVTAGTEDASRGLITVWNGPTGTAPGVLKLGASDGTVSYLFPANDGSGLRIHSALPTADTDGFWLTAGRFRGPGSSTDAVDLGSGEVAGTLAAVNVGNGLTDAQVNNDLTLAGGTINQTPIGAGTASSGKFTTLQVVEDVTVDGGDVGLTADPDLLGLSAGQLTVRGNVTAQTGGINAGVEDTASGWVHVYGDDDATAGYVTVYNSGDNDGLVDHWSVSGGLFGAFCLSGSGGTQNPGLIVTVNPGTAQVSCHYGAAVLGGDLSVGNPASARGVVSLYMGSANAPGCVKFYGANGTPWYVFATADGAGLRIHNAAPSADSDGAWLTSGTFRGSGSTTDAVDLATAEVAGTLPASSVGNGLTDTQVNNDLTISGGAVNNTPVGASVAAAGVFTGLTATGVLATTTVTTFSSNDQTPDVSAGNVFKVPATWTAGTNITNFDNGTAGQTLVIIGGSSNCVASDVSPLRLAGAWTAHADDTLTLVFDGSAWRELSRSDN